MPVFLANENLVLGTTTNNSVSSKDLRCQLHSVDTPGFIGRSVDLAECDPITDGSYGTCYSYAPVTSQPDGELLTSWSFHALNSNVVIPVIYSAGSFSHVIGHGQAETPGAGEPGELQTFAYGA
jgi:hypothetical protein